MANHITHIYFESIDPNLDYKDLFNQYIFGSIILHIILYVIILYIINNLFNIKIINKNNNKKNSNIFIYIDVNRLHI